MFDAAARVEATMVATMVAGVLRWLVCNTAFLVCCAGRCVVLATDDCASLLCALMLHLTLLLCSPAAPALPTPHPSVVLLCHTLHVPGQGSSATWRTAGRPPIGQLPGSFWQGREGHTKVPGQAPRFLNSSDIKMCRSRPSLLSVSTSPLTPLVHAMPLRVGCVPPCAACTAPRLMG